MEHAAVRVNAREAQATFSTLLDRVRAGEEVVIEQDGADVAVLRAAPSPPSPRRLGTLAGRWPLPDDGVLTGPDPDVDAAMDAWDARGI